jgi:hypothetical protein
LEARIRCLAHSRTCPTQLIQPVRGVKDPAGGEGAVRVHPFAVRLTPGRLLDRRDLVGLDIRRDRALATLSISAGIEALVFVRAAGDS